LLLHTNDNSEELLYDFSINEGDSIYDEYRNDYYYVDSIVPTLFGEETLNVYHITSKYLNFNFRWIEKLGSDFGVLKPYGAFLVGAYFDLLCLNNGTELFYQNPNFGVCHRDNTTTVEDFIESPLLQFNSISPGTLTINTFNQKGKLSLYTIGGQFIQKADLVGIEETICLPINGVIIYQFIAENNKTQTGKILIK
jgi:hypothetical protein